MFADRFAVIPYLCCVAEKGGIYVKPAKKKLELLHTGKLRQGVPFPDAEPMSVEDKDLYAWTRRDKKKDYLGRYYF